jgi:hypothetical protein
MSCIGSTVPLLTGKPYLRTSFYIELKEGQILLKGSLLTPDADRLPTTLDGLLEEIVTMMKRRPVQMTFDFDYVCSRARGPLLRFLLALKDKTAHSQFYCGLRLRWCDQTDDDDMIELAELLMEITGLQIVFIYNLD